MTSTSIKRIIQDLKSLDSKLLESNNIYYYHDEDDIFKGYAMIIGPENTPYYHGFYFFDFNFPQNYPFSPPVVKFRTYNGETRFHPNLYVNGKVCLSLLNTWQGDAWNSCQSLETVLMNLIMLLDKNPLLNEPGVNDTFPDLELYNQSISFKNIEHSFLYYQDKEHILERFQCFYDIIAEKTKDNKDKILTHFQRCNESHKLGLYSHTIRISMYNMITFINYDTLKKKLKIKFK